MELNESPVVLLLNTRVDSVQKDLPVTLFETGRPGWCGRRGVHPLSLAVWRVLKDIHPPDDPPAPITAPLNCICERRVRVAWPSCTWLASLEDQDTVHHPAPLPIPPPPPLCRDARTGWHSDPALRQGGVQGRDVGCGAHRGGSGGQDPALGEGVGLRAM